MDSVDIVQSVSGLFPNILYRAMHSEGVLMFSLGMCPSKLIDIKSYKHLPNWLGDHPQPDSA